LQFSVLLSDQGDIIFQRLSSSGYVFSASLPPYLATAAVSAVNYLEQNPAVLANLRSNIALLHKGKLILLLINYFFDQVVLLIFLD
jgi:7-keto-8-aminopelargonate synthetase-like enzyme